MLKSIFLKDKYKKKVDTTIPKITLNNFNII